MHPRRSTVTVDLRGDAGQTTFRCVPEVTGRGATVFLGASLRQKGRGTIVFLGASLEQEDAVQLKEQCVGTQSNRRISACERRSAEGGLRLVADHRRENSVPVLRCSGDCIFLFIRCSGLVL